MQTEFDLQKCLFNQKLRIFTKFYKVYKRLYFMWCFEGFVAFSYAVYMLYCLNDKCFFFIALIAFILLKIIYKMCYNYFCKKKHLNIFHYLSFDL